MRGRIQSSGGRFGVCSHSARDSAVLLAMRMRWASLWSRSSAGGSRPGEAESEAALAMRRLVTESAERIKAYLDEIQAIGCLFKGFDAGLIDFYTLREDRLVFLCWRVDEEHITHWHEVDSGYAGRQPIDATFLTTTYS